METLTAYPGRSLYAVQMNDLAARQPQKVKALAAKWEAWAKRAHVIPHPEASQNRASD